MIYGVQFRLTSAFMDRVPWRRLLVSGHSQLRPGLDPCTVHVMFVVSKVAEDTFFSNDFDFSRQYISIYVPLSYSY
jgi:hypothetical protein